MWVAEFVDGPLAGPEHTRNMVGPIMLELHFLRMHPAAREWASTPPGGWVMCDSGSYADMLHHGEEVARYVMDYETSTVTAGPRRDGVDEDQGTGYFRLASDLEIEASARGIAAIRELGDGRELTIQRIGAGQGRLCIGPRPGHGMYDDAFDYPTEDAARAAMAEWDGHGDAPLGWTRNLNTNRRRPGGDPAQEFIRP